ncbi:MAG: LamG domain-containing protein [Planctomycetia bacterium]|nr:LamG domain-containing protein [Planctomycetia bacterium]
MALLCLFSGQVSYAGLLANWNFDDGSLADTSGNGMALTQTPANGVYHTGSFSYLDNGGGKAISAGGNVNAYVDFGSMGQLNNYTVSMWVDADPRGWDNYWTFLGSSNTTWNDGTQGIRFQSFGSKAMEWNFCVKNPTTGSQQVGDTRLTTTSADTGSYNHLVCTVSDGTATFYYNGTALTTTIANRGFDVGMGLFSLAGSVFQNSGDNRNMKGDFDNVSVYNRALTAAEVASIYNAGSATTNNFADIYSRELSGTTGLWSQSVWNHQLGESGTVTANRTWDNYSQVKLSSSGNATLTIDQDIHTSKTTLANGGITLSVADGKTAVLRGLTGSGFTKSGAGTMKIEGEENYGGGRSDLNLVVEGGILDITGDAKLFDSYNTSVVTVKTGGTLRIGNLVNYAASNLKYLTSNNTARIFDGGTIEIVGGDQAGNNSFQVTTNGGTFLNSTAGTTVRIDRYVENGGDGPLHPLLLNGTLTVGGAGNFLFNAPFHGSGGLTKIGSGTVTIASSENLFTGDVTVQEGILAISGKVLSKIQVQGGELQIRTGADVSGSALKLESSAILSGDGLFSIKSLDAETGSRILLEVGEGGIYDALKVAESVVLGEGVLDFDFGELDLHDIADTPMTILTALEVSLPENLTDVLADSWRGIVDLQLLSGTDNTGYALVANVSSGNIPEPATWVLGLLGCLGGVWLIKRKRG